MKHIRIRAGRLIDGTSAPPLEDGALLVENSRIVEVGPNAAVPTPDDADTFEFPDLTLLPGLVDCHTHLVFSGDGTTILEAAAEGEDLLLFRAANNARNALESGVTTLRENGSFGRIAFSMKEAIRHEIVSGPRLSISGRPITITGGHCWPMGGEADGIEGVRFAVRQLVKEGADWIKVMATGGGTPNTNPLAPSYSVAELQAAVDEAHAHGRLTAAHVSCTAAILKTLDAGFDMLIHCDFHEPDGRYIFQPDIARRIADQGIWVNPTLHVNRVYLQRLERLAEQRPLTETEAAQLEERRRIYADRRMKLQGLLEAGVKLVAGSDAGWGYYPFGRFVDELEAMVEAGMDAAAAVQAGTLESARSMGLDDDVGSLESGKQADLLLVDGDPTGDIMALEQVAAVFLGGSIPGSRKSNL